MTFAAHERVLVLAPHPDDESIASGGLLQAAQAAGAAVRIVVLTDGDNNPWPQRWVEKRWRIDAAARARWGSRRREEAGVAMRVLGIAEADVRFLGLPDTGMTDLLMRADAGVIQLLLAQFDEFAPTQLVLPALSDRHPDHSAVHILSRLALHRSRSAPPRLLSFAVHGNTPTADELVVSLSEAQRSVKQEAILAHASQMQLSRRRFLGYATTTETYQPAPPSAPQDPHNALQVVIDGTDALQIRIDLRVWKGSLSGQSLFLALESVNGASLRWLVALHPRGDKVLVRNYADASVVAHAILQRQDSQLSITIARAQAEPLREGYVKLARSRPGWWVLDQFGWQAIARRG